MPRTQSGGIRRARHALCCLAERKACGGQGSSFRGFQCSGVGRECQANRKRTGVIGQRAVALTAQLGGQGVHVLARDAVDDAGFARMAVEHGAQLVEGAFAPLSLLDPVEQVRPVEGADQDFGRFEMHLAHDVVAHALGRRCRVTVNGHAGQRLLEDPHFAVLGAEIVAPHADAVHFVDGDEGDADLGQEVQESAGHQALGRDVEQFQPSGSNRTGDVGGLDEGEAAVEASGVDAALAQGVYLVFHQRD